MYPRISIVTPCFNSATYLEAAITSVLTQGYPDLEYVVIDGASTDSSTDIIERYADRLAYWVSEPDGGHYHALNKGFAKTTGEVMGYLNADDLLMPGALHLVGELFRLFPDMDWLTGAHTALRAGGLPLERFRPVRWSRGHLLSERTNRFMPQESTFWRRSLWDRAGGHMEERYRLAGDFELWARFSRYAVPTAIDAAIGCFRFVEGQRSVVQRDEYLREVHEIRLRERALSPADEKAARVATAALATRSMFLRRRREAGLDLSPVLTYRSDAGRFERGSHGPDRTHEDLRLLLGKVRSVLAGQEGLDLTPAKLTKLARDLVRLAAAEAGHAGARAAHHTRQLASWTRLGLSTVFSRAARRQGDGDGLADRLQTALRDHSVAIRRAYAPEALHGDRIFQGLIRQLIREVPIGSVVETGTYLGATTGWVASEHPTLPVYTCEIDPEFLGRARRRLWRLRNVRSTHASSERFVHRLLEGGRLMGIPLFFLDAHWQRYWPLRDELGVLAVSGKPAVIVIDDFRVPDRPEFGFDTWETEDGKQVCDFDLVAECLDLRNDHRLLVPAYEARDAFHAGERALLRGHLVIFQNLSEPHERLVSRGGVVSRHYVPVDLPPRP